MECAMYRETNSILQKLHARRVRHGRVITTEQIQLPFLCTKLRDEDEGATQRENEAIIHIIMALFLLGF